MRVQAHGLFLVHYGECAFALVVLWKVKYVKFVQNTMLTSFILQPLFQPIWSAFLHTDSVPITVTINMVSAGPTAGAARVVKRFSRLHV